MNGKITKMGRRIGELFPKNYYSFTGKQHSLCWNKHNSAKLFKFKSVEKSFVCLRNFMVDAKSVILEAPSTEFKKKRAPPTHSNPMLCFEVRRGSVKQAVPVLTNRVSLSQELNIPLRELRALKQRELSSLVVGNNIILLNILDKRVIIRHDRVQIFLDAFGEEHREANVKELQEELHYRISAYFKLLQFVFF